MKSNSLNLIRILAALQVFWGHAAYHLDADFPQLLTKLFAIIQGVPVFFLISGFLIWNSLNQDNSLKSFARKRILRLYPELWGGVLLSGITILLFYREYLDMAQFVTWICTQSTILQFWTPDCLRGYGCGTPNGSLWTIGVMIQCYVILWLLHKFLHGKEISRWILILTVGVVCNVLNPYTKSVMPEILSKLLGQTFLPYIWIFVFGALLCERFRDWKPFLIKYWWFFLIVSSVVTFSLSDFGTYGTIKVLTLTPAIIGFAYRYPSLNVKYDISYGLYIYHMVVINVLIECGYIGKTKYIFIAFTISAILAIASYLTMGKIYRKHNSKLLRASFV